MKQERIKSLTGIKNAILKHKKVWLTIDEKSWVYVELRSSIGKVWINYGISSENSSLHNAMTSIYDFLSFKHSTDLLGG